MYRILLVDDEILVRDAIRENVDWAAMNCTLVADCENGKQALEVIEKEEIDIVLTDILMPFMDGMELSRYLHEHYPDIVIVIFSGFGEFEYAKKAIEYNVSEYMLKPVTSFELREVIEKMKEKVNQSRAEKEKLQTLAQNSSDYRKNALVIRSKAFEALVHRSRDVEESLHELAGMGIALDGMWYRPAIFDMDVYADFTLQSAEKQQESALMTFILFNIADEVMQKANYGYAWMEGNSRVNLLFSVKKEKLSEEKFEEVLDSIRAQIRSVIGLDVSVALGVWVHRPEELYRSDSLAREGITRRYLLGDNMTIDMEKQNLNQHVSLQIELDDLGRILKTGNSEEVMDKLFRLEEIVRGSLCDKSRACMYMQQILYAICDTLSEAAQDPEDTFMQTGSILQEVTEKRLFSQAMAQIRDYARDVNQKLREVNSSAGQKQAVMAMDYLQSHYMDEDLNLNAVCSYLNISTSYFSTIFKELTGETFIEALTRIRMEKAKELLRNTKYRNYEIAEKVGFSDPHYFGIAFKKMTGKTPTEYARENRK